MKIAFIGAGNMAGAIIGGMCCGDFAAGDIAAFDIDTAKTQALAEQWNIQAATTAKEAIENANAVVLAIKPQMFPSVLHSLQKSLKQIKS